MDLPAEISALRMSGLRSNMVTLYPAFDKYTAHNDPTNPAPTTVAVFMW